MEVLGNEVATGIHDPLIMFIMFGAVLVLVFIVYVIWQVISA